MSKIPSLDNSHKNPSYFFIRVLVFGTCIPFFVAVILLYFILSANSDKILAHYKQQSNAIEYTVKNDFDRITDSLDKIYLSKELNQFLEGSLKNLPQAQNNLIEFLSLEKQKIKNFDFTYCIYRSNFTQLYTEQNCPDIQFSQENGIELIKLENIFVLHRKYIFNSAYGKYDLFVAAAVPMASIKNQFSNLENLSLNSSGLSDISLYAAIKKDLSGIQSAKSLYVLILCFMTFFLLSILYGTRISYLLKRKAEDNLKLATIGKVAHFLAHDIKKPFQNIKIFQKELALCHTQEQINALIENTQSSLQSSQKLIESTLQELMDTDINKINVKLHLPVKNILENCISAIVKLYPDQKNLHVSLNHTLYLNGDESKLSRVFINLISNAFDASKRNLDAQIKIESFDYGKYVRFIVSNSHSFISAKNIKKIFEPFFSTKGEHGTGLGLTIAKKVIEMHGGKIICESKRDSGVRFIVDIPAQSGNIIVVINDCPLELKFWTRYFKQANPFVEVKTFLKYEDFFTWHDAQNKKSLKISDIICDYCINESSLSTYTAIQKINSFFEYPVLIASHFDKEIISTQFSQLNFFIIDNNHNC